MRVLVRLMRFSIVYFPSCIAALALSAFLRSGTTVDLHRDVLRETWSIGLLVLYGTTISGYLFTLPVLLAMLDRFPSCSSFLAASVGLFAAHMLIGMLLVATNPSWSDALLITSLTFGVSLASALVCRRERGLGRHGGCPAQCDDDRIRTADGTAPEEAAVAERRSSLRGS